MLFNKIQFNRVTKMGLCFLLMLCAPTFSNAQDRLRVDYEIMEYMQLKSNNDTVSAAIGTVGNGTLKHAKLMPYKGENFIYFDRDSYLAGRAFLHGSVRNSVLTTYDSLHKALPHRYFNIMECSNENGGEMFPHKTHQNGMSIDFMMPLLKDDKPYYALDTIGTEHYMLSFDDDGEYSRDSTVSIDFNLVARQILLLDYFARQSGLNIFKVIIKIELKDELFATEYGKLLKASDIYVVQGLSPLINSLHDEHFHIDFGFTYNKTPQAQSTESFDRVPAD
jgi:penicillin-insensitive murein endopeptidase